MGDLDIRGGSQKLMDADFTYNEAEGKPDIKYTSTGTAGDLIVEQNGPKVSRGSAKNDWHLRFNDTVPMDLNIQFGAGDANLKIGSMNLRGLDLNMGAGDLHLDLRALRKKAIRFEFVAGRATLSSICPGTLGIWATASGGLGDISVNGLHKSGDHYENDAYDRADVRVRLDIQGGVGDIKLNAE